ncbi:hypothetical protein J8F10_09090 [Gemmata sp. G18]|uniref:Uncharacterized protein n=1 Tax=Gemmata palustris TaxID=2822762 RepID=A0ABS5BNY3_9BACT|nr:hypothetical protein [Gemmata palustris]MBP3955435.1 hypothetical protein [Gemmata palustris]
MNRMHRPGLTLWHTAVCCLLVAMSTTLTMKPEPVGYSPESRRAMNALVASTSQPKGYAVYDSGTRADQIAELWGVTDLAKAEAVLKLLDGKRFRESGL